MLKSTIIEGRRINLRSVKVSDADFILSLRLNPELNRYIGKTDPSIELQKEWIQNSIINPNDFTFIIEDKEGLSLGTIAVYNIYFENGIAEWGRWVMNRNSSMYSSIEATLLVFFFAFKKLRLKKLIGGSNNQNVNSVRFHSMYATITSVDKEATWFEVDENNFQFALDKFKSYHNIFI